MLVPFCMSCPDEVVLLLQQSLQSNPHVIRSTVPLSPHQNPIVCWASFVAIHAHDVYSTNHAHPTVQNQLKMQDRTARKRKGPRGTWRGTGRYRISPANPTPVNAFSVARGEPERDTGGRDTQEGWIHRNDSTLSNLTMFPRSSHISVPGEETRGDETRP